MLNNNYIVYYTRVLYIFMCISNKYTWGEFREKNLNVLIYSTSNLNNEISIIEHAIMQ